VSIKVNGKKVEWVENETVKKLLKRMKFSFPLIVVKINKTIIPRDKYIEVKIPDNSNIEIIHMISGG
jgi:thiamine biosynthesis protein ThiS